jgi:hypothetical protein
MQHVMTILAIFFNYLRTYDQLNVLSVEFFIIVNDPPINDRTKNGNPEIFFKTLRIFTHMASSDNLFNLVN